MEDYFYSSSQVQELGVASARSLSGQIADSQVPCTTLDRVVESTVRDIIAAIKNGDYSHTKREVKVKRRALLVAAQYIIWPRSDRAGAWMKLPSTPNDVWHIYKMLRDEGYEASNIRILVEGIMDDDQYNPTKLNIMKGLDWLVEGTQLGDYRYFHFSGHGAAFETSKEVGKLAREIPGLRTPTRKNDTELLTFQSDPSIARNEAVISQTMSERERKYYNEALTTAYKMPLHTITDPVERENWNRVRDYELNAMFSKLPKGCTLTTSLDELISKDNNLKLLGSGFRGGLFGSCEQDKVQEPLAQLIRDQDPSGVTVEDHTVHRNGTIDKQTLEVKVLRTSAWEDLPRPEKIDIPNDESASGSARPSTSECIRQGYLTFGAPVRNYFLPPRVNMVEKLPTEEANRDNIKATIMAWSGCHQRQVATDHNDSLGGYFTWAFTSAISELRKTGKPTVRMLHQEVDKRLKEAIGTGRLQYAQLWTSLRKNDEDEVVGTLGNELEND